METKDWSSSKRIKELLGTLPYPSSTTKIDISDIDQHVNDEERKKIDEEIELLLGKKYIYIFQKSDLKSNGRIQIGRLELDTSGNITRFIPDSDSGSIQRVLDTVKAVSIFDVMNRDVKEAALIRKVFEIKPMRTRGRFRRKIMNFMQGETQRSCEVTNESIEAIMASLEPNEDNKVLSICGTGDVPLAFLEYGCSVDAIDLDQKKIELAKESLTLLSEGHLHEFLSGEKSGFEMESMNRRLYFMRDLEPTAIALAFLHRQASAFDATEKVGFKRVALSLDWTNVDHSQSNTLKAIARNAKRIHFQQGSILEALSEKRYSKVWLSNIIFFTRNKSLILLHNFSLHSRNP